MLKKPIFTFKTALTAKDKRKIANDLILVIIGSLILAFASGIFLVPSSINAGGISGIGIIVDYLFNFSFSIVDITVGILAIVLFIVGWIFLGTPFAVKTALSTILFPTFLSLFIRIPVFYDFAQNLYRPDGTGHIETARILIGGLFGGALTGVGVGMTFLGGGSTGGVDVITLLANKYLKIKQSSASFIIDTIVVVTGMFILTDKLISSLVGVIAALICAIMIDFVFVGRSSVYTANIISSKWREINDYIQKELERGTTIFHVEGGYQFDSYRLISVVFERKEYNDIYRAIAHIDPKAFVTFTQTQSVYGEGFNKLINQRTKGKNER